MQTVSEDIVRTSSFSPNILIWFGNLRMFAHMHFYYSRLYTCIWESEWADLMYGLYGHIRTSPFPLFRLDPTYCTCCIATFGHPHFLPAGSDVLYMLYCHIRTPSFPPHIWTVFGQRGIGNLGWLGFFLLSLFCPGCPLRHMKRFWGPWLDGDALIDVCNGTTSRPPSW